MKQQLKRKAKKRQRQRRVDFRRRAAATRCAQRGKVTMPVEAMYLLILLAASEGVILIASNLAALKIWNMFSIPVDAGIFFFPIVYVTTDLLVYLYGRKVADAVAWMTTLFAIIAVLVLAFAEVALQDFPGVDNSAFIAVRSATGRIFCASVAGFLASSLMNNYVFDRLRRLDVADRFQKWELASSFAARLVDSLLFEILAFVGRLPFGGFVKQAAWAYGLGTILEVLFSVLLVKRLARYLRYRLGFCNGKMLKDNEL